VKSITWLLLIAVVALAGLGYLAVVQKEHNISTYAECVAAGNIVQTSYPSVCVTKNGKSFVEPISDEDQHKLVPPSATITP
jgi:hypothetical protein